MRIAIVHDWLTVYGGAEKVLEQMLLMYPDAVIYSLVDFLPQEQRGFLQGRQVRTSFIQRLPFAKRKYRMYLPLMPLAVEQFDLSEYDLVLSSSYAVAKGVLTGPDQLHLCMCHSPIRYAWDMQHQYLKETGMSKGLKGWFAKWMLHKIRLWDYRTADGVNGFIANSKFIARRIWKVYRRDSTLIYPPVNVDAFALCEGKDTYYVTASRMVPYKRVDLIVKAFNAMPDLKLYVIGDGPEYAKIKELAGPNVTMLGYQPFGVLRTYLQQAKAFIFAAEEDFGIVPVEAQACGTPVIAYGKGGVLETIRGLHEPNPTGVFFTEQSLASIVEAVRRFERHAHEITAQACRDNAMRFSEERFRSEFHGYVTEQVNSFFRQWSAADVNREVI